MNVRKRLFAVCLALLVALLAAVPAFADIGPKPSVDLTFQGMEGRDYAVTLIFPQEECAGPWGHESWREYQPGDGPQEYWQALADYEDPDGWQFWGFWQVCTDSQQFTWNYWAPGRFKILIWQADTNSYLVSPVMDRYAYASYFDVTVDDAGQFAIRRSYDYTWELISLVCRVVLTVLAEVALAWLIGWRTGAELRVVLWVNVLTQLALNATLNVVSYYNGILFTMWFVFLWLELAVFVAEALLYCWKLPAVTARGGKRHVWLFSLSANLLTMVLGFLLAKHIPGIF